MQQTWSDDAFNKCRQPDACTSHALYVGLSASINNHLIFYVLG